MPSGTALFAAHRRRCSKPSTGVAAARRLQPDPRKRRRRRIDSGGDRSGQGTLDPDDPLPRTMEELYRRIASEPPLNLEQQYKKALEPDAEEMGMVEEAVRATFKCTEDDAWWDENGQEWDRMAENPGKHFALGREEDRGGGVVWGMQDYFGEEAPEWGLSDEPAVNFSLSAYKAGIPERPAKDGEGSGRQAAELFERTPFAQYWESVPDLRTAGRVYAYNAVDRMAALKFLMNCTYNGMHGSAESMQSGHFLWGYVDQLDWMRRSGRLSSTPGSIKERIRRAQWAAHLESLDAVEALYGKEFDMLPSRAEREFARGWCRAARLFAVAAAHTNLERCLLPLGAGYAPERLLTDDDDFLTAAARKQGPRSLESVPFGPPDSVAEAERDSAVVALNTRRCVTSVRWLGTLRAPVLAGLCRLWRRSCASYPARRRVARVLREACYGGRRAKAAAWAKSFLFLFVPDLNYRKLTFPLGVDPAEEVEYDPDFEPRDFSKPYPRPVGSRPLNPLQWPWYEGRRPDPSAGLPGGEGWGEDDDGLLASPSAVAAAGGMFPPGREPVDGSFEAGQRREQEVMEDLRALGYNLDEREGSKGGSGDGEARHRGSREGGSGSSGGRGAKSGARGAAPGEGKAARPNKTVFL
ncbi:expressed unknown protein [Ectocarpus siliculosus]|uniref:Uncharacterized protein n=1 Tax=Ectocarpus siliculosus TaxID=2880 RepID=D8LBR8_ECTSI|nr:expressed unknown protein [Ectocarpus siliculosus]|eukprot:CBN76777.1 expressed unknown protein [Ectocarpus siliculosus]